VNEDAPAGGAAAPAPYAPVAERDRIRSLDVLRGFAILGIFFVNMQFFTLPFMRAINDDRLGSAPLGDLLAWGFVKTFCEYKFISMFSLLFGAGLVVQMIRAEAAGRHFLPLYLRRMAVLALFGMAHALLLWYGDILFIYACLGTVLVLFKRMAPRMLFTLAAVFLSVGASISLGCGALQVVAGVAPGQTTAAVAEDEPAPDAEEQTPPNAWQAMFRDAQGDPSRPEWQEAESRAYREGPLADAFAFRSISWAFGLVAAVFGYGWHVLAMFLTGAGLMKVDFFRPARIAWQRRMALVGIGVGLPLEAFHTVIHVLNEHQMNLVAIGAAALHEFASAALCLGYVGATCWLVNAGRAAGLGRLLANVGRMALSTYLLETIAATFVMYWWGLGRFDQVSRPQQLALVVGIYAGLIVFSTIWLRWFRIGPFEWLWRSATYLRPQPARRHEEPASWK
jgi:uncharacterized protein